MNNTLQNLPLHVFIADDDSDDIDFFISAFRELKEKVKITVACDGAELIEFLKIVSPDIIFLDMNMPCMNGIDCLTEIRKLEKYNHIPVIIYSTTTYSPHVDKTYALGACRYFEKPTSFSIIKKRISEVLSVQVNELLPQVDRKDYLVMA